MLSCQTRPYDVTFAKPALLALAALSSLAITIIEDDDESSWEFGDIAIVYHLNLLVQVLNSFPVDNALQELAVTILGDFSYNWRNVKNICGRLEAVAAQLAQALHQDSFNGVRLRFDIRLRPSSSCTKFCDRWDIGPPRGVEWKKTAQNVQYDKNKIRMPNFTFRPAREQIDRSFEVMHSLLAETRHEMSWEMTSTEMSAHSERHWQKRVKAEIKRQM
jgi:hypothetical protein